MSWFWKDIKSNFERYEINKLIDYCEREPNAFENDQQHFICDIDKTYLETEFDNIVEIAKIAFEEAYEKTTVAGASEVLTALRWQKQDPETTQPFPLHFVSSSPPQLRAVIEEKFLLDGLDWSSDTFKNQAYNLRKAKMHLLRHHVPYKIKAIFNILKKSPPDTSFCLIGDNAETDPYIYLGLKLLTDKLLTPEEFKTYLSHSRIDPNILDNLMQDFDTSRNQRINGIYIRKIPGKIPTVFSPITDCIYFFSNFFEASLAFMASGFLHPASLWNLVRYFHNTCKYDLSYIVDCLRTLESSANQQLQTTIRNVFDIIISQLTQHKLDSRKSLFEYLASLEENSSMPVPESFTSNQASFNQIVPSTCFELVDQWLRVK